ESCTIRRTSTDTPLQALVLWNDGQFVEAARALAQRTLAERAPDGAPPLDDAARLTTMVRRCTGRRPDAAEGARLAAARAGVRRRREARQGRHDAGEPRRRAARARRLDADRQRAAHPRRDALPRLNDGDEHGSDPRPAAALHAAALLRTHGAHARRRARHD